MQLQFLIFIFLLFLFFSSSDGQSCLNDEGSRTSQVLQVTDELPGCLYRGGPDLQSAMVVQSAFVMNMFGILYIISSGILVYLSNYQFAVEVSAQYVVTNSKSKYDDLFAANQLIIWVFLIIVGMLLSPFILHFAFDKVVFLYICCWFVCLFRS